MGLGYHDSIIVYNRYVSGVGETEYYVGTRFDHVRLELTQGANIRASGMENADACLAKIPNVNLPYKPPKVWLNLPNEDKLGYFTFNPDMKDFFAIIKSPELGIDVEDLPTGLVASADYSKKGFYDYVRGKYGYTYAIHTADVYELIPRFEVSGQ